MDNSDIIEKYNKRIKDIESIFKLYELGYSPLETEWKLKVASSYVIECLKKGKEEAVSEISQQYGINLEDKVQEKSSLKKQGELDNEFICIDCAKQLTQIEDVIFNDYTFRMYKCPKCSKTYPHPLDTQGYLRKDST